MKTEQIGIEQYKKRIRVAIIYYVLGCVFFIILAVASIWTGILIIMGHDLPHGFIIFAIGGVFLIWEMICAIKRKVNIPESFKLLDEKQYPFLFKTISKVTEDLQLPFIEKVYLTDGAIAAVFIETNLKNLFRQKGYNLVLGSSFLSQLDDDELRAILYHEFGHFSKKDLSSSASVYRVGQFSRAFTAQCIEYEASSFKGMVKSEVALFTYYTMIVFEKIEKKFNWLSRYMEYEADDVAKRYITSHTLRRSLFHAAKVRYCQDYIEWGLSQLPEDSRHLNNIHTALSYVSSSISISLDQLPLEIKKRICRLGNDNSLIAEYSNNDVGSEFLNSFLPEEGIDSEEFSEWLVSGYDVYSKLNQDVRSVRIEIALAPHRHKLPWAEGFYHLLLDGKKIGSGNFKQGYKIIRHTGPGKHILKAYAPSGITGIPFEFETESGSSYHIEMDFKVHIKTGYYDILAESITEIR